MRASLSSSSVNASNQELVRTKTLMKNRIVPIDLHGFAFSPRGQGSRLAR